MNATRLLVAAKRLDPEASSEGICSSRFVQALVAQGVPVSVLTSDEAATEATLRSALPWLTGRLRHGSTLPPSDSSAGAVARRLRAAVDLAGTTVDGHPTWYRRSVRAWRDAIATALTDDPPEVLMTRGAGGGFEPHLAVLELDPEVPWVAHYHDPWPASRWPPPYQAPRTRAMRLQEQGHERILRRADALTFPSARLRDWIVGDDDALRAKCHVVPHILDPSPAPATGVDQALVAEALDRPFALVHTGTLLRHRRIDALVEALTAFVAADQTRRAATRLVLAGPVTPAETDPATARRLAALEDDGVVRRYQRRVSRPTAVALVEGATAAVLIEATGHESPFFPAKLTDYVRAERPVLALSPRDSVASDLMGEAHPLRVAPDDAEGVLTAITVLWDADSAGTTAALRMDEAEAEALRPDRVAATFTQMLDGLTAPTGGGL